MERQENRHCRLRRRLPVFGEAASYLKLGFTYPLPINKIRDFAAQVETLYVVEELEPYIEEQLQAAGIACVGKAKVPKIGRTDARYHCQSIEGQTIPLVEADPSKIVTR